MKGRPSTGGLWGVGRLYAARLPGHHRLQPACRAVNTGRPAPSGGRKWAVRRPVRPLPTAPVLFDRQRLMRDKIRNSRNYRSACTFDRQRLRPVKHRPQRLHPPEQLSEPRTHPRRRRWRRLAHLFAMWGSRLPARAAGDSRSGSRSGSRQQIRKLASVRATSRRMRAAEASVAAMAISSSTPTQLHTPRLLAYARHTPAGSLPPCHHSSHSPGHHSSHAPCRFGHTVA